MIAHPGGEAMVEAARRIDSAGAAALAIGPEGGFTESEVQEALAAGWRGGLGATDSPRRNGGASAGGGHEAGRNVGGRNVGDRNEGGWNEGGWNVGGWNVGGWRAAADRSSPSVEESVGIGSNVN